MSRGYGRIERKILAIFDTETVLDTYEIAARAFDYRPNGRILIETAHLVSTRRALHKLAREGRIVEGFRVGRRIAWLKKQRAEPTAADGKAMFSAKLAKVLGMLGSDHNGEVVAAARAAVAMLKSEGLTWQEVIQR